MVSRTQQNEWARMTRNIYRKACKSCPGASPSVRASASSIVTYVAPFQPRAAMTCPPFKRFIGWAGVQAIPSYRNSEDSVDSLEVGESTTRYAILNPGRLNPLHIMSTILGGIDMYEGGGMANWRGKFFADRYQATGKSSQL